MPKAPRDRLLVASPVLGRHSAAVIRALQDQGPVQPLNVVDGADNVVDGADNVVD